MRRVPRGEHARVAPLGADGPLRAPEVERGPDGAGGGRDAREVCEERLERGAVERLGCMRVCVGVAARDAGERLVVVVGERGRGCGAVARDGADDERREGCQGGLVRSLYGTDCRSDERIVLEGAVCGGEDLVDEVLVGEHQRGLCERDRDRILFDVRNNAVVA